MIYRIMAVCAIWLLFAQNYAKAQGAVPVQPSAEQQGNANLIAKIQLKGKILDTEGKGLELVTVSLYQAKDTLLISTTFTEKDGSYSFDNPGIGKYVISASLMGYKAIQSPVIIFTGTGSPESVRVLTLSPNSRQLKEVNVTGRKAYVEQKLDRVVVNVDALIANAGTTAMDVLEKSPGVQVDQNGAVSLKGKQGVTIFIDDKPSYLSGADLENYLKSLPSSSLEQIEIMSNPPAKYDAAGNGGVINIKTKKGTQTGFNGAVNLSINQGHRTRSANSANFNIRNNKFNYFANLSYNHMAGFTDLDINRRYKNEDGTVKSLFSQNSFINRLGDSYGAKAGADYYQSSNTTWGIVISGMLRKSEQVNNNTSNLFNAALGLDSVIKAVNTDHTNFKNGTINFNYRHQFDQKGQGITADADYLNYRTRTDQVYNNSSYLANGKLKSADVLSGNLPSDINIYTLKTDYTLPLSNAFKFEAGLKSSFTKTDNTADYFNTVAQVTTVDYDKSNHFIYRENINAAYLNLGREMKRLSVQLGLRMENTVSDGNQLGNFKKPDSTFRRNYFGLFPTVYLLYKLDTAATHQLGLNYGRRIDRPYFQDLNPFISPLDKFTFYVGNPFLKPSYTNSVELSHTFKSKYTTTLSYSSSKDDVGETIEIVDGIYYSRPLNIGKKIVKSISFNAAFTPAGWLNINLYTEVANIKTSTDFYTGRLNSSGTYFFISPNASFKMGHDWQAEISGNYRSKLVEAQFELQRIGQANMAVQKKLSKSSTLKLSINDIFYTRINKGTINNLALTEANWVNRADSRLAILSYSYRFGKAISSPSKHETSGADAEKNRVKN
jgi:ferric enterobactin receptor